jgi:hypothetical protein
VRPCGRARGGGAGVGVVYHTLAETEDYLLHVILIGTYLCDVALNDALCVNRRDFHVLGTTERRIVFGGLCRSANGIVYPLLLIVSVLFFSFTMLKTVELSFSQRRWGLCVAQLG